MTTVPRVALTLEQCWHRVPGGTAVSILGAAGALADRDDVAVIGVSAFHRRPAPEEWTPPVSMRALPLPRRLLYETWHYARRPAVERATGPVDVVHATTLAIPPRSAPLVVTIHDLAFVHDPTHFTRHGLRFFHRGLDLARRDADLVTVPSDETRRDCLAHGFEDDRVRVVPWATDAEPVGDAEVDRVRSTYGLDRPFVLWVGTIEPRKNLPTLLAGFDALDRHDVDLVLVGPDGWNEELGRLQAGRARPARALGFVPRVDLHALYAAADVFCYPSRREGFGLPVLEAMAQGTAVVTSAGTSTAEVAGDAGLLVDPTDRTALAEALARLLDDPAERVRLGRSGQARADRYQWSSVAEQLAELYREVSA